MAKPNDPLTRAEQQIERMLSSVVVPSPESDDLRYLLELLSEARKDALTALGRAPDKAYENVQRTTDIDTTPLASVYASGMAFVRAINTHCPAVDANDANVEEKSGAEGTAVRALGEALKCFAFELYGQEIGHDDAKEAPNDDD